MHFTETHILDAIKDVLESADNTGCPSGRTAVSAIAVERLSAILSWSLEENRVSRHRGRLTRDVLESQQAANPRPISLLLHNCLIVEGHEGGNPQMAGSPLVRVCLNTLLNVLGPHHSLPAYDIEAMLYHRDVDALEAYLKEPVAA